MLINATQGKKIDPIAIQSVEKTCKREHDGFEWTVDKVDVPTDVEQSKNNLKTPPTYTISQTQTATLINNNYK